MPYERETGAATRTLQSISAHDTRTSAVHPLRHAVINLVRAVGELRASSPSSPSNDAVPSSPPSPPAPAADALAPAGEVRNGAHYLLTSLTLFTTHEPCIMCSMALLHSRVKEVVYLLPMPRTGGCGGAACVPRLKGVNHRYAIDAWKLDVEGGPGQWAERCGLAVDEGCDA